MVEFFDVILKKSIDFIILLLYNNQRKFDGGNFYGKFS